MLAMKQLELIIKTLVLSSVKKLPPEKLRKNTNGEKMTFRFH